MDYAKVTERIAEGETAWRDPWLAEDFWIGDRLGKTYLFTDTVCLHPYEPTAEDLAATDWNTTY